MCDTDNITENDLAARLNSVVRDPNYVFPFCPGPQFPGKPHNEDELNYIFQGKLKQHMDKNDQSNFWDKFYIDNDGEIHERAHPLG